MGVMAALRSRDQTGKGQMVEGALMRTVMTYFSPTLIEEAALHLGRKPTLNRSQTAGPSDIYKAKDGWITVAVNGDPLFRRVGRLIGAPEWIEDPRFCSATRHAATMARPSARRVGAWVAQRTQRGGHCRLRRRARAGRPRLYDAPRRWTIRMCSASDIFTEVEFPGIGTATIAATPVKLHGTPGTVRMRPPILGEHSDAVLTELGYSPSEIAALKADGVV